MSQFQLKVLHVLENKYFQNAEVVAGHEGLLRIVKWAHVLEIVHVDNFLVGEELVLTTGISLQHGIEDFMTFIESLIEKIVLPFVLSMALLFKQFQKQYLLLQIVISSRLLFFMKRFLLFALHRIYTVKLLISNI